MIRLCILISIYSFASITFGDENTKKTQSLRRFNTYPQYICFISNSATSKQLYNVNFITFIRIKIKKTHFIETTLQAESSPLSQRETKMIPWCRERF